MLADIFAAELVFLKLTSNLIILMEQCTLINVNSCYKTWSQVTFLDIFITYHFLTCFTLNEKHVEDNK
jgi:hypothetical protein